MVKKISKLITIGLLITIIFFVFQLNNSYVQAIDDIVTGADNFINKGVQHEPIDVNDLQPMSDTIYNILLVMAIIIAVIVGSVIGIKFMTGSVAEKAQVKETLIPYVAGCVVIFGAFGIWKLIIEIMKAV